MKVEGSLSSSNATLAPAQAHVSITVLRLSDDIALILPSITRVTLLKVLIIETDGSTNQGFSSCTDFVSTLRHGTQPHDISSTRCIFHASRLSPYAAFIAYVTVIPEIILPDIYLRSAMAPELTRPERMHVMVDKPSSD